MLNVLLECVKIAYSLIEFVLKYISSPAAIIKSLFVDDRRLHSRLPRHLAILYTEKTAISLETLCELLVECAFAGIKQVSIYDPWSCVHLHRKEIMRRTAVIMNAKGRRSMPSLRFSTPGETTDELEKASPALTVNLLGKDAGKRAIVKVCRKLCANGDPSSINAQNITASLALETITEPELLLKVGQVESMCGYPPWSLRVTEILPLRRLDGHLSRQHLISFLDQFNRRERRFGR
uniref:ditrans,polycis-polyprenyl diphosphate synthase [(2E,6E)-farnesyldiphosphate specific] n=1 Tax=Parascaris univalens TaxID=6257 RepID=A0A914ZFS6_PARUN